MRTIGGVKSKKGFWDYLGGQTGDATSMGGSPALGMAWGGTLDMDSILLQNSLENHSRVWATDPAFAAIAKLFVKARSKIKQ